MIKKTLYKHRWLVVLITFCFFACEQNNCLDLGIIENAGVRHYRLTAKTDTIDFINASSDSKTKKPVLIFCQGSLPIPLVIKWDSSACSVAPISSFDYQHIIREFHLIVISKPNTPVCIAPGKLSREYAYVKDTADAESFFENYVRNNSEENYINRTKLVIEYLVKQNWVDAKRIFILGHSEGARIAVKAAVNNNNVLGVGFLNGNNSRICQLIKEQREHAKKGKFQADSVQREIELICSDFEKIYKNGNAKTPSFGNLHVNKSWTTFSKPITEDILNLNKPIFVGYSTRDERTWFCDFLKPYFIMENKNNLTLKAYVDLEHNFYEVDSLGNVNYDKGHWQEVIEEFISWTKKQK